MDLFLILFLCRSAKLRTPSCPYSCHGEIYAGGFLRVHQLRNSRLLWHHLSMRFCAMTSPIKIKTALCVKDSDWLMRKRKYWGVGLEDVNTLNWFSWNTEETGGEMSLFAYSARVTCWCARRTSASSGIQLASLSFDHPAANQRRPLRRSRRHLHVFIFISQRVEIPIFLRKL